ncbi:hypothetical protein GCM10017774_92900 [Lentzea cavernae]|uniref:Uncharacterized protein n=1 Tax=Lentzea cavernae TaxID=2020703 RepID=A0ABQ3MVB7_9PSEU|nr:hypothetical protein GCM10017774_92900 [Lentzea cavernae]
MHNARPGATAERVRQHGDLPLTAHEQATLVTHGTSDEAGTKWGNHADQQIAAGPAGPCRSTGRSSAGLPLRTASAAEAPAQNAKTIRPINW